MESLEQVKARVDILSAEDRQALLTALGGTSPEQPNQPHTSQSQPFIRKLRIFSGKKPVPAGEVDFDTWSVMAKPVLDDSAINENTKKRVFLTSLLRPALEIASSEETSDSIFQTLKVVFGTVSDGHELYIQFLSKFQGEQETSSQYLQRLYLDLLVVEERGGVSSEDLSRELLDQFIRGSRDENLILRLKLEDRTSSPPTFADLLLEIRKEEVRSSEKKNRFKTSARTASQQTSVEETLSAKVSQLTEKLEKMERNFSPGISQKSVNKDWKPRQNFVFCYNCGMEGHKCQTCVNPPNPTDVQKKLVERTRRSKIQRDTASHSGSPSFQKSN